MARAMSSTESAIWTSFRRDRELHANDRTITSVADGLFPERLPSHGWSGRPGSSGRKRETLGDEANRRGGRPRGEKIAPRIRLLDGWSWPVGELRDAFCRPPPIVARQRDGATGSPVAWGQARPSATSLLMMAGGGGGVKRVGVAGGVWG